jgi:hypothetical protein
MTESDTKSKALREGYLPEPFVFRQVSDQGVRVVAWSSDLQRLKRGVLATLERFPNAVEVLFKTQTNGDGERDGWRRFVGMTDKATFIDLATTCEQLVYSDGGNTICIRRPDTGEYLALDEHGILFVYSSDPGFLKALEQVGFENRVEPLLFEAPHWHIRPPRAEELEQWFIKRLALEYVP